jgi:hypothetical protein
VPDVGVLPLFSGVCVSVALNKLKQYYWQKIDRLLWNSVRTSRYSLRPLYLAYVLTFCDDQYQSGSLVYSWGVHLNAGSQVIYSDQ